MRWGGGCRMGERHGRRTPQKRRRLAAAESSFERQHCLPILFHLMCSTVDTYLIEERIRYPVNLAGFNRQHTRLSTFLCSRHGGEREQKKEGASYALARPETSREHDQTRVEEGFRPSLISSLILHPSFPPSSPFLPLFLLSGLFHLPSFLLSALHPSFPSGHTLGGRGN